MQGPEAEPLSGQRGGAGPCANHASTKEMFWGTGAATQPWLCPVKQVQRSGKRRFSRRCRSVLTNPARRWRTCRGDAVGSPAGAGPGNLGPVGWVCPGRESETAEALAQSSDECTSFCPLLHTNGHQPAISLARTPPDGLCFRGSTTFASLRAQFCNCSPRRLRASVCAG